MGKLKRFLFVIGILLCFYPVINQMIAHCEQQEVILEYQKNPSASDVIGIIEIPKIDVFLPVYHGTTEAVLEKGIGHLEGSSLPVGGNSTHCLLAGHRGLPDAALFTRLGEMEEGDCFYIEVRDERLAYQVCEIRVIKPEETEGLGIQRGRDLVSLITCTPYGINTHRLIVTGERMEESK